MQKASQGYAEHIRTEYSTFRWLLQPMLAATGFEIAAVSFDRRLYGAYTCVKTGSLLIPPGAGRWQKMRHRR